MPTDSELQIQATFADACDRLLEDQLYVLMDDYKALMTIAAIHRDTKACAWLETRVSTITDAYGLFMTGGKLPF